jgi:hypothetical protein
MFKSSFLTNLFEDTNVARIFYKLSQTCDTKTENDKHFKTEGACERDQLYAFLSLFSLKE